MDGLLGGARFISIRPPMEIQPIAGLPPAQGFIGGRTTPGPPPELENPEIIGLATSYENQVFLIRRNDPTLNHFFIGSCVDPRAWKQLGKWLQHNTHVSWFCIGKTYIKGKQMADLCDGLQHNTSIGELTLSDLGRKLRKEEVNYLSPFIRDNPNLHTLNLDGCLGACSVELFATALMTRERSLECISLDGNSMGGGPTSIAAARTEAATTTRIEAGENENEDGDGESTTTEEKKDTFDILVTALCKHTDLHRLSLMGNQIGVKGCEALSKLLKNPDSSLTSLVLRHNYIDDKCCGILADALSSNTELNNIDLDRNDRMSPKGVMKLLNLICRVPGTTINIIVHWDCPALSTEDMPVEMTAVLKIKLNEPLHTLGSQLYANPQWAFSEEDIPNVKLMKERTKLHWDETPFFYNMKDGDSIDVIIEADNTYALPNILDIKKKCVEISEGGISCTASSNHTLSSVGYECALKRNFIQGILLRECLEANKQQDKNSASRIKIFRVHVQYALSIGEFVEMNNLGPRVLAWISNALNENDDERTILSIPPPPVMRLDANYRILRGMPMLCGYK